MSLDARLDKIPNFVRAKLTSGLRMEMLRNNVKHARQFIYHNIQFVDGYWYAWFYESTNAAEVANAGDGSAAPL